MREDDTQVYFFDTSALVKRYHRELGTDVVDAAFGAVVGLATRRKIMLSVRGIYDHRFMVHRRNDEIDKHSDS